MYCTVLYVLINRDVVVVDQTDGRTRTTSLFEFVFYRTLFKISKCERNRIDCIRRTDVLVFPAAIIAMQPDIFSPKLKTNLKTVYKC
jgi:hypothetical protein